MRKFQKLLRVGVGFLISLFFLLHAARYIEIESLQALENKAFDFRLNLSLENRFDRRIVIVDIDEESLKEEGRWPWNRKKLANLVEILFDQYQINVLGFDVLFAEPDTSSGLPVLELLARSQLKNNSEFIKTLDLIKPRLEHDLIFANTLRSRATVLGYYFKTESIAGNASTVSGELPKAVVTQGYDNLNLPLLLSAKGYGANLSILQQAAASGGFIDTPLIDNDGIIRRVPLIQVYKQKIYEAFSLAVLRAALGSPPLQLGISSEYNSDNGKGILESIQLGPFSIPVDQHGSALIPFRGHFPSFQYISAKDVLAGSVDKPILQGSIVLIGTTAAGLLDMRATPVQNVYPGVEIHANLIAGILDEHLYHRPAYATGFEFAALLIIGLLLIFIAPRFSLPLYLVIASTALIVVILFNFYMWSNKQINFPLVAQVLLILMLSFIQMIYGYFIENRNKRQLTRLFGQYVPPELVEEMSHQPEDFALKGDIRELTVMFTDIRNFTSISELMSPQQLTLMLNEYFTEMTSVIQNNRGTMDKYLGDGIMAFWGAPLADQLHASHAVRAAWEMIGATKALRAQFRQKGWPEINIGIGINTGSMHVGNMGSKFRMSYTVLGDEVNLGSRLENLTKYYGVKIIVSEKTKALCGDFVFRELDIVRVAGKGIPVRIFEPVAYKTLLSEPLKINLEHYHQMIAEYRKGNWKQAQHLLKVLVEENPHSTLYQEYNTRILRLLQSTPENWDPIFTYKDKY